MRLGLINNKHIPVQYLASGTEQRLALLRDCLTPMDASAPRAKSSSVQ